MKDILLEEIKKIQQLLSELIGTSDLPAKERFSKEAIAKAAKDYRKMAKERGDWLTRDEIRTVIKKAPWRVDKVLIGNFGFANYFKHGNSVYFNKKDLIALNLELKRKNINIAEYCELLQDQDKFKKDVQSIKINDGKKRRKKFIIPEGLRDLNSKHYPPPSSEVVIEEIKKLMDEYGKFNLSEYVSILSKGNYAWFKYDYTFDRYLDPKLKTFCRDWCFKFNYANDALKKIKDIEKGNDRQY